MTTTLDRDNGPSKSIIKIEDHAAISSQSRHIHQQTMNLLHEIYNQINAYKI